MSKCDVLVVGGGVAGVAAAASASRRGAETVLIEREACLGGIGYAGLLHQICGLYDYDGALLNSGIAREIADALGGRPIKLGRVWVLPYDRIGLRAILYALCAAVAVHHNAEAVAVEREGDSIDKVSVRKGLDVIEFQPRAVVDCTGDGALAHLAGARRMTSETPQPGGFIGRIGGVAPDDAIAIKAHYVIVSAVKRGALPKRLGYTHYSAEGYLKIPVTDADAECELKRVHAILCAGLAQFRGSHIEETSMRVVQREGGRVMGRYVLTAQDVLSGARFDDGVVRASWPIELWHHDRRPEFKFPPAPYDIPLRCLLAKGIDNLYMAGRCVSVTREALGSTRVMGTCISLGEQAGLAAS